MNNIKHETLVHVLSQMLRTNIIDAHYQMNQLQGGTLGDVCLVAGTAKTAENKEMPYKVVMKKQKKWMRPGDPHAWRREYDLYLSDFGKAFTASLRWPACYHEEMSGDETQIWLEHIDGISGSNLSVEMLEFAATELGRFQGRHSSPSDGLRNIMCLGDAGFMEREFCQWHTQTLSYDYLVSESCGIPGFLKHMLKNGDIQLVDGQSFEYSLLHSKGCGLPEHLKKILVDIDTRKDEIFGKFMKLPVVLCHRDFWNENIFFSDGLIKLIDWDTAGWGFLGEDIASLIVDGMDVERFEENYQRLVPAYLRGLSEYMDIPPEKDMHILEMVLIKFGYRMMQEAMFSESSGEKCWGAHALQKIDEMRDMND